MRRHGAGARRIFYARGVGENRGTLRAVGEVGALFTKLGLTSFGGPVAHLGYFHAEFVERRKWLTERAYGDLVALCQFLPGPASSQVGFAIGFSRAGFFGALIAFLAFTLPSAALMFAFALGADALGGTIGAGIITGLKIVAVAIVAQAVWSMARTLTPDAKRAAIAVIAIIVVALPFGPWGQLAAIAVGALLGLILCRDSPTAADSDAIGVRIPQWVGITCLAVFAALLVALPVAAATSQSSSVHLADVFYRAGAFVFGGGHVVLPLLESTVVATGDVSATDFLAGYGFAQAMPGPLFTFSSYLGAISAGGPGGISGAAIALLAIFLPGFLLLVGVLPFWDRLRRMSAGQALMRGASAAVVGILAAALYDPVFTSSVVNVATFALAAVCFVALMAFKAPPWSVVLLGAAGGVVLHASGLA